MLAMLGLVLMAGPASAYLTVRGVPLPKPRPAEAPSIAKLPDAAATPSAPEPQAEPDKTEAAKPAAPPPPSECRLALTDRIAIAPSIPDIAGPGACGGTDLVRLEAVVLADNSQVPLKPPAVLRCKMATAMAEWIRGDMAPLAASLGGKLGNLDNFNSFECRGRNRVAGAKMSEHGKANAIDIRGVTLADGRAISLTDRSASLEVREKVLLSVCKRFTTVLGPGSDWYHEDHIHLDIAERRGGYRICQWDLWEPLPQVAPLLPAMRPDDAPPREVAKVDEKPAAPQPAPRPAEAEPEAVVPTAPPPVMKKRRTSRRQ
jgi:hypothetical protein